ncbi:unnamed protein product, partial [marine sediment metagenome]
FLPSCIKNRLLKPKEIVKRSLLLQNPGKMRERNIRSLPRGLL